jgi:acyl-CoA thioester hydrolase
MTSYVTIEPRFQETDLMGIIHHSVYAVYYEIGRIQYCKDAGMPYEAIIKQGVHLAIIDLVVNYHHSATLGDVLVVKTTLSELSRVKMVFTYEIKNQHDMIINTGSTTLCWLNSQLKPINIQKSHPHIHDIFMKAKASLLHD